MSGAMDSEHQCHPIHDDIILEVFKHLDAFSLARVSCVSKQWCAVARHEKLWESQCILHWPAAAAPPKRSRRSRNSTSAPPAPCSPQQIGAVVESLGGFRRFFLLHLGPMLKRSNSLSLSSSSASSISSSSRSRWGRDEVNLSLSLYSIECFLSGSSGNSGTILKRKISSLD